MIHVRPGGSRGLKFGCTWLTQAGLDIDLGVDVELTPDLEPDRVDLPAELAAALHADPEIAQAWSQLAPGRRKTMAYDVARAKRPETRQRHARAVIEEVRQISAASS